MSTSFVYLDTTGTKGQIQVFRINGGSYRISSGLAKAEVEGADAQALVFDRRMSIWDEEISRMLCAYLEKMIRKRGRWSDKRSAA